jgi:hypothetical protein
VGWKCLIAPPLQQRVLDVMSPQAQAGYLSQRVLQPASRSLKKEMELERAFVKAGGTLLAGPNPTGIGANHSRRDRANKLLPRIVFALLAIGHGCVYTKLKWDLLLIQSA